MASPSPDLAWMYAAVEAVARGDIGEIEGVWDSDDAEGNSTSLRVTIRREVQHINLNPRDDS